MGEPLEALSPEDIPEAYRRELEEKAKLKKGLVPTEETIDFSGVKERGGGPMTPKQRAFLVDAASVDLDRQTRLVGSEVDMILGAHNWVWNSLTKNQASKLIDYVMAKRGGKT